MCNFHPPEVIGLPPALTRAGARFSVAEVEFLVVTRYVGRFVLIQLHQLTSAMHPLQPYCKVRYWNSVLHTARI